MRSFFQRSCLWSLPNMSFTVAKQLNLFIRLSTAHYSNRPGFCQYVHWQTMALLYGSFWKAKGFFFLLSLPYMLLKYVHVLLIVHAWTSTVANEDLVAGFLETSFNVKISASCLRSIWRRCSFQRNYLFHKNVEIFSNPLPELHTSTTIFLKAPESSLDLGMTVHPSIAEKTSDPPCQRV